MTIKRRQVIGGGLAGVAGAMLATPANVLAQAIPAPVAALDDAVLDDIAIIRGAMALHPGAHRYLSPAALESGLSQIAEQWRASPDRAARYIALARFLATLRCGHSYPNFFNQTAAVRTELFDRPTRLPFAFRWIDSQMVVTGDRGGMSGLSRGAIITQINGTAPAAMLAALLPLIRADGGNDAKRRSLLEMRGDDALETFDIFHGLIYGPPADGVHRIAATHPAGNSTTLTMAPITLADRQAERVAFDADAVQWEWSVSAQGIATLTMPTWGLYDSRWNWQAWLDERLDMLTSARGLIIDLRGNEGGLDCGNAILARLAANDLRFAGYERRVRFRTTAAALNPYLDTWDDSFRTLGEDAEDLGDGFYRLPREAGVDIIPARGPQLTLPVAVLIDASNSSATFAFAEKIRSAGLGRLFGTTSGGNRRGINGEKFFFVRLPDSGLSFDLPLVGTFPATPQPDAGLEPDVAITPTVTDIALGNDVVAQAARQWIIGA